MKNLLLPLTGVVFLVNAQDFSFQDLRQNDLSEVEIQPTLSPLELRERVKELAENIPHSKPHQANNSEPELNVSHVNELFNAVMAAKRGIPVSALRSTSIGILSLDNMEGYGCWCRLSRNTHGMGRAGPVDAYDSICQKYHKGVECLQVDYGDACNPWDVDYSFSVSSDNRVDCNHVDNDSDCKKDLCEIEACFVMEFIDRATDYDNDAVNHVQWNPSSPDFNSDFDQFEDCKTKKGNQNVGYDIACCGEYPNRFPYRSVVVSSSGYMTAQRDCCNGKTFDAMSKSCCNNRLKPFGYC